MYNLFRSNFTRFLTGIVAAVAAIVLTMSAQAAGSTVSVGSNSISASANVSGASSIEIRVGGPGGYRASQQSDTGVVTWDAPAGLADGAYRYEVFVTTGTASSEQGGAGDEQLYRENGNFNVQGGAMSPVQEPGGENNAAMTSPSDKVSLLSRIVTGLIDVLIPSAEAADVTSSNSYFGRFVLDENDGGDITDWYIDGGFTGSPFRIVDDVDDAAHNFVTVIQVSHSLNNLNSMIVDTLGDIGLADNSVFIDKSANFIGIGTAMPSQEVHVVSTSPSLLLDDTVGGDITITNNSGEVGFNITNNTDANGQILTLENNFAAGFLYPGLGIWQVNPIVPLHVKGFDSKSAGILAENTVAPTAAGDVTMFELRNTGTKILRFKMNAGGANSIWTFDNDPNFNGGAGINSGRFRIAKSGTGVVEFFVDGFGNSRIPGTSFALFHQNTSSRELKTDFKELNQREVLDKLASLPVTEWTYKRDGSRHFGPVAEEFQETFGLGDGKHISTVDTAGVTMAAIQGLYKVVQGKDAEINALKVDNMALAERLTTLNEGNKALADRLSTLEALMLNKEVALLK